YYFITSADLILFWSVHCTKDICIEAIWPSKKSRSGRGGCLSFQLKVSPSAQVNTTKGCLTGLLKVKLAPRHLGAQGKPFASSSWRNTHFDLNCGYRDVLVTLVIIGMQYTNGHAFHVFETEFEDAT